MRDFERHAKWPSVVLIVIALAIVLIFPLRYGMPFRLDDVLLIEWSNAHSLVDAFSPEKGQIVNSVRPVFAITAWILTKTAGAEHPLAWHFTLVIFLAVALIFLARLAKHVTKSEVSLVLTPIVYLLGFISILNVFFWFSDLTYALELSFTTIAWYYGIRGLIEGRLGRFLIGILTGILAVLSKEPSIVMVHLVLLGTLALQWRRIRESWRANSAQLLTAALSYAVLIAVTLIVISVSPTRINRFFAFSDPNLRMYIGDRVRYYSTIYCSPIARALLFFPILFVAVRRLLFPSVSDRSLWLVAVVLGVLIASELLLVNALIVLPILVLCMTALAVYDVPERAVVLRLLPFLATILLAFVTLLVTIQLVKTQLTEIAFMTTLIAVAGWVMIGRIVLPVLRLYPNRSIVALTLIVVTVGAGAFSKIKRQEQILRQASDVRWNANDAAIWSAKHLPQGSSLAVSTYSLYGFQNSGDLTGSDDETKLKEQATFDAGFVYIFLEQLGRRDIDRAYLADSTSVRRVLDAYRHEPNSYLFLQTELDRERLHPLLSRRDSMVAKFSRGGFASEVWLLRS